MVLPSPTQLAPLRDMLATLNRCVSPICRQEGTKTSPSTTADDGQGLEWRDAVAEDVRSEVSRSLVTMLRGSTPGPADRRGRARRSSRRHQREDSSSSLTTDVSRSGDDSAVSALLRAVRATPTPSTVREGTRGIDPRTLPTPDSVGGEQGGGAARALPRGIDPGFPTQLSLATGTEAEGWPTHAAPTPPTRVVPLKIVVNHPYYRIMFDCETYALDKKTVVYRRPQARTMGRRKKDVAQSFGVHDEWDGSPPAKVFQFLRKFAKACDDNDISEGDAFYILQDFTNEPLKSEVMMVIPTRGFGIMIRIKHRSVSSGILLAATSYVHQSFHEEPEHEVSFPAVSSVLLSHWMARRFPRIYPDISGYIPDSAEKPGF